MVMHYTLYLKGDILFVKKYFIMEVENNYFDNWTYFNIYFFVMYAYIAYSQNSIIM